jgi:hypothetical protein
MLASASATLLAATGLTLGVNASADAATCYGGAVKFFKREKETFAPQDSWFQTSSRCNDINLSLGPGSQKERRVKVCFYKKPCQERYTHVVAGTWTVIATDVKDGTKFRFMFETQEQVNGRYAA